MPNLNRRVLIASGLAVGTATILGGCGTGAGEPTQSPSSGSQATSGAPDYIAFDGPKPDLPGDAATGVPNGYLSYPDPPPSTGRVPLKLSRPVEMHLQMTTSATPRERNQWWQALEKDLGTQLKVVGIDSTQYRAKFQTMIAGNVLSEITQIVPVPSMLQVLESLFTDLSPYLSGDGVKKYPNLANLPPAAWDMCMVGGKVWGLTNPRIVAGSVAMTNGAVFKSKGIEMMPSLSSGEDFLDLCREVTDRSKGIFAFGQIPEDWTVPLVLESLGAANVWAVDNGSNWKHVYESPAYEQALEIVSKMWSERLIHPSSYSDLSGTLGWFRSGATVMWSNNFSQWMTLSSGGNSADFPVGAVVMPKWGGGGVAAKHLGVPGYSAMVGLKKTDDVKRIDELLRVGDYMASPFGTMEYATLWYGVSGRQYNIANGQVEVIPNAPKETIPGLPYYGGMNFMNIYAPGQAEVTRRLHKYLADMIPTGVRNPATGKTSESALTNGARANRKLKDLSAQIIQGRAKLAEWAGGVAAWKREVGDAMAREYGAQP